MYNIVNSIRSLRCVFSLLIRPDADGRAFKTPDRNGRDKGSIESAIYGVCYSACLLLLMAFAIQTAPAQKRENVKTSKGDPETTKKTSAPAQVRSSGKSPCGGAKRILIATTLEVSQTEIHVNLRNEFTNNAPLGSTVVSNNTELTNGVAPPAGFFSGYDVVVISSVFKDMDSLDFPALQSAIINKESNAFVFFTDFCSSCSAINRTLMTNLLNAVKNLGGTISIAVPPGPSGNATAFVLNTGSLYSGSFAPTLNQFYGNDYRPINGIPVDNRLYINHPLSATGGLDETYAMVLPLVNSLGAGVFVTTDASWSDSARYPSNTNKVAPAFYAATSSGGSMFVGTQEVDLSLAASVSPTSQVVGGTVTYTFTVTNNSSTVTATGVKVSDFLPTSDLTIGSTSGCSNSPASPCIIASIAPGASVSYTLTATVKPGPMPRTITATSIVNAGPNQVDPANCNNAATTTVSVSTAPTDGNLCCPPWNSTTLSNSMVYQGSGGISQPYTLKFQPSPALTTQMEAYVAYIHALYPSVTYLINTFSLHNAGTGSTCSASGPSTVGSATWTPSTVTLLPLGFYTFPMVVNNWYKVSTLTTLNGTHPPLDDKCINNSICFRIQVAPSSKAMPGHAPSEPTLQMQLPDGRIIERPVSTKKPAN